ncbi:conserved hypothetical protein [Roseibium sp. TrichSKD4]|uniref:hypothetical protein n=1 Tax=Roseibium sp. TrichSKD4 TaxID=744980 RepID=UPI0001E56284|nr:hypothetical protein [Roseibium sp. TrichSKD4]EFO34502.1 conserved hypothetical protein [Roseibium sp. TrichSKD4]
MTKGSTDMEGCPVPEEVLGQLIHETLSSVAEKTREMPEHQRSRLAVFCYRRSHLRRLGLAVAANCSRHGLVEEAGHAGEVLYQQAANPERTLASDTYLGSRHGKKPVSLRRV